MIVIGNEHAFYMGPARNIVPLTLGDVSNPRILQIAESMNLEYLDLSTPGPYLPPLSIDEVISQKQAAIQELVDMAIIERRRELGLSQLMNSSPLGMAALSARQVMVAVEVPQKTTITMFMGGFIRGSDRQGFREGRQLRVSVEC